MKNENYYVVHGWMKNELDLSGNELTCYAIIYGFCQDEETEFNGKAVYVADFIGCTREYAIRILRNLTEKGLIIRKQKDNHYNYTINTEKLPSSVKPNKSEQSSPQNDTTANKVHSQSEKSSLQQSEKSSLPLIDNNIYIYNNNSLSSKPEVFDAKVVELWNSIAEKYHLAKISMVTPARHKALLLRMKEIHIQDVEELFSKIRQAVKESPFLRGKQYVKTPNGEIECHNRDWICHFDFFLQQSSLLKALEGGYADPDLVTR